MKCFLNVLIRCVTLGSIKKNRSFFIFKCIIIIILSIIIYVYVWGGVVCGIRRGPTVQFCYKIPMPLKEYDLY